MPENHRTNWSSLHHEAHAHSKHTHFAQTLKMGQPSACTTFIVLTPLNGCAVKPLDEQLGAYAIPKITQYLLR